MKILIKSVKNLKLWSKKNRKKKKHDNNYEHPPHLPCHHCCSCFTSTTQPSAPHLPPFSWLEEVEQDNNYDYGTFLLPPEKAYPPSQAQDIGVSVSEPVYGIPVLTLTDRSTACVIGYVKTFNMKETEKIGIKIKLMVMDIIAKSSQAKHDLVC
uniref:Uncharacterized protein n=1 Tax=Medicago truncatula TaxID=3880 RepID=Q1SKU2_MEDTR|nr:hypothetical protein MtrDRAFT_AC140551g58v2 [Medicago truncatula]